MKIISNVNVLILSKKDLISKKDKNQHFYQLIFFVPETEETHKCFVSKDKFDLFDVNNIYGVELTFIIDEKDCKISVYLK